MAKEDADNPVPLFRELQMTDEQPEVTEIESLCFKCYGNGITKLMLTKIPHFKEVIISSFNCEGCGFENREIKSGGRIQEKGHKLTLSVTCKKDLDRQVIKSEDATFAVPELEFEQPSSKKGEITTIEGIIDNVKYGLEQDQIRRRVDHPEIAQQIDKFIDKWIALKDVAEPFTFVVDDISGNSFIENPSAPKNDPNLIVTHYLRTTEQDRALGLNAPEDEAALPNAEPEDDMKDEVMVFKDNCPSCNAPCDTNMKMIDIPHFKQVIIMASNCDACGLRENEVKSFSGIAEKGKRIKLKITDKDDVSRDLLKSDTCGFKIPEIDFELLPGTLGGKFTTVEGLIQKVKEQLRSNQFLVGDSAMDKDKEKMAEFCEKLDNIARGDVLDVHIILDDPTGNSYLQNLYAPDPDPHLEVTEYERSQEQNEELGLLDMKTENYTDQS